MLTAIRSSITADEGTRSISEAASGDFISQPPLLGRTQAARTADAEVRRMRSRLVSAIATLPCVLVTEVHLESAQRTRPDQLMGGVSSGLLPQLRRRRSLQRGGS